MNDAGPVRLILDTGASRSTLASAFAAELGLALADGGEVEGSAGVVAARSATARLALDGHDELPIDFVVYDFASYDPRCVGILGAELLERAPFQLRYRQRLAVWNASPPPDTIELALDNGIPRVSVRIGGQSIDLRIDTGAAFPPGEDAYVNLTEDQAGFLGLEGAPVAVFTATGTGGARLELPVHRLDALEVASIVLPRAFAIVQPRVGYFAREDAVGFLGNSVLDKLDPFLDYRGRRFGAEAGRGTAPASPK